MLNPFEIILERLTALENKLSEAFIQDNKVANEIIDRKELCKRLDITEPTAIRWEHKGKIPCFRIGSNVRYNWPKVVEALENKTKVQTRK